MRLLPVILLSFLYSCSKPGPAEVVREFKQAIASGECEYAKSFVTGGFVLDLVQASIDRGCIPFECNIRWITCKTNGDKAFCDCREQHPVDSSQDVTSHWTLENKAGTWTIEYLSKDFEFSEHCGE